ncbi:MAG: hypothetical protein H7Y89_14680 [Steroidobacteraceae bacterium]|nr:hypothetical protein [Steroidobacteraceae bacterium]
MIVNIGALPAEVDGHYIVAVGVLGDLSASLRGIAAQSEAAEEFPAPCGLMAHSKTQQGFLAFAGPLMLLNDLQGCLAPDNATLINSNGGNHGT